ncbi:uncharacterized protein LOC114937302 [Nylanderia fulva]|uniref:uncharacterized protein LOC114937302 n=1 Tax=Nylanderia fulva TaxID=613905 RepID=UPI0010FB5B27|nr:uncharacterized protein LOC114937302 [Nylanderia fulva]
MDILQEYIFSKLNFRPCLYRNKLFDCLCIDYVLENKRGEKIVVLAIFCSIARRLGLRCDIIRFSLKHCIFWKSKYIANNIVNERCFYIKMSKKYPDCIVNYLLNYKNVVSKSNSSVKTINNKMIGVFFDKNVT